MALKQLNFNYQKLCQKHFKKVVLEHYYFSVEMVAAINRITFSTF